MDFRRWLVAGRLAATFPFRFWNNYRAMCQGTAPIIVLFYHRVADSHPNAWTISCDLFERQMRWLKRHTDMVSLAEAQRRIRSGKNSRVASCVTFDDGYADNCEFALPYLLDAQIPCTYFVASDHVLQGRPFPHDEQAGVRLRPNTPEQIQAMAKAGVEIGAHTKSHADLGQITCRATLYDEIAGSGEALADLIHRPIRFFAFPYGQPSNLSFDAMEVALDAGFQAVCSAYGGYNRPGGDGFHLQRVHGDPDMIRFQNWMTVDPRKWHLHPPYASSAMASRQPVKEA